MSILKNSNKFKKGKFDMKNVNVNELSVVSVEEMEFIFNDDIVVDDNDVVVEVMVGCRGIVDEVKKVDVVDGMFKVNDVDDIEKKIFEDIDEEEFDSVEEMNEEKEFMKEFVCSDIDEVMSKKMYVEGWYEESVSYYVRVV